jgi:DUF4097 and DUF4098 domain-containing protein YvlB
VKNRTRNGWFLALGLCIALVSPAALAGDKMSKTFDFPRGGKLTIDVDSGHVEIQTGGSGEVTVEVSVNRGDLEDYVDLSFHETGEGLEILGEEARGRRHKDGGLEFLITAPSRMDLDVSSGGGHIRIDDVEGQVDVNTGGGHVKIRDIQGDLEVQTGGGHLEIGRVDGELSVRTGGGHVEVDDVLGDVQASSGGGHINVGNVDGDLEVRTGGGHISVEEVDGMVELKSGGGNISVRGSASDTEVETGGGNVTLEDMEGFVLVRTAGGDIDVSLADGNDHGADLETEDGFIEVRLPQGMGFDLDARTHDGEVESRVDFRSGRNSSRDRMEGTIGRGGSKLRLVTHEGDIIIREN